MSASRRHLALGAALAVLQLQQQIEELGHSVERLQALGEVGQAVSSTLDLQQVLRTIVARAVDLDLATP